jgi:hypothetical protein
VRPLLLALLLLAPSTTMQLRQAERRGTRRQVAA